MIYIISILYSVFLYMFIDTLLATPLYWGMVISGTTLLITSTVYYLYNVFIKKDKGINNIKIFIRKELTSFLIMLTVLLVFVLQLGRKITDWEVVLSQFLLIGNTFMVAKAYSFANKKNIFYLKPKKWYSLGIMKVKTEPLVHDVENYGLKWKFEGKKCFYATDTSNLDGIEAKGYDLYLIEANYNEELLKRHIEECEDENKLFYLNRVASTHLSFEQSNSFLIENMGDNSRFEYIHKSDYNFEEE